VDSPAAPGRLDLFALGMEDRRVYGSYREEGKGWQKWSAVGKFQFTANARLSALSGWAADRKAGTPRNSPIDLFGVRSDGRVYTTSWELKD